MDNLSELKRFCKLLADESGKIIKQYYRTAINIETKEDESPVTIADKKAEEVIRNLITKEFPDHGIIGEEFGELNSGAEYKWVLDPIDGTKSFVAGTPLFGTLIALMKNNEPILGVINQPVLNDFMIGDNESTLLNNQKVKVRECNNLSSAVLVATDHLHFGKYRTQKGFDELVNKVKLYRMWGDCYGYFLIAAGYADIMIDPIMNPWDLTALIPIIKGAGGTITDYYGGNPVNADSIIATAGKIHGDVISILNTR